MQLASEMAGTRVLVTARIVRCLAFTISGIIA
jgi:hypothetical protein